MAGRERGPSPAKPRGGAGTPPKLAVRPLTPERWQDLEAIFAARGCSVARRCWCMYYRRSGGRSSLLPTLERAKTERADLKKLVDAGRPPGLIAYRGGEPVGWVSLGPREEYARLARSPVMKAVDDLPVWSIVCFVVPSAYRGQNVPDALLDGAIAYARQHGARMLEAYPVDTPGRLRDAPSWFGSKSLFDRAGFEEVARRKADRPIVRKAL